MAAVSSGERLLPFRSQADRLLFPIHAANGGLRSTLRKLVTPGSDKHWQVVRRLVAALSATGSKAFRVDRTLALVKTLARVSVSCEAFSSPGQLSVLHGAGPTVVKSVREQPARKADLLGPVDELGRSDVVSPVIAIVAVLYRDRLAEGPTSAEGVLARAALLCPTFSWTQQQAGAPKDKPAHRIVESRLVWGLVKQLQSPLGILAVRSRARTPHLELTELGQTVAAELLRHLELVAPAEAAVPPGPAIVGQGPAAPAGQLGALGCPAKPPVAAGLSASPVRTSGPKAAVRPGVAASPDSGVVVLEDSPTPCGRADDVVLCLDEPSPAESAGAVVVLDDSDDEHGSDGRRRARARKRPRGGSAEALLLEGGDSDGGSPEASPADGTVSRGGVGTTGGALCGSPARAASPGGKGQSPERSWAMSPRRRGASGALGTGTDAAGGRMSGEARLVAGADALSRVYDRLVPGQWRVAVAVDSRECGGDGRSLHELTGLLQRGGLRMIEGWGTARALPLADFLLVAEKVCRRRPRERTTVPRWKAARLELSSSQASGYANGDSDDEVGSEREQPASPLASSAGPALPEDDHRTIVVPLVVERKRIDDAVASFEDGRWTRQVRRMMALTDEKQLIRRPVLLVQGDAADPQWRAQAGSAAVDPEEAERHLGRAQEFGFTVARTKRLIGCVGWLQRAVIRLGAALADVPVGKDDQVEQAVRSFDAEPGRASSFRVAGGLRCPVDAAGNFHGRLLCLDDFLHECSSVR